MKAKEMREKMNSNTEMTDSGIELYTHRLFELADQYITEKLGGDEEKIPKHFRDFIFYAADRVEKPSNDDIEALDSLFLAYVKVCAKYERLPTLECFSWLVKIDRNTFTDWKEQQYRSSSAHGSTVKKWLSICRGFVLDELSNAKFANPNLIFTAKAAYGLRETAPIPAPEARQITSRTPEEIAAGYGKQYSLNDDISGLELPEPPEDDVAELPR